MLKSGTILHDRYQILHLLGQGGFSQTYVVNDNGTKKVLKVLLENYPKAVHLFQREAKVLGQLRHPGIPAVEPEGYFTVQSEDAEGKSDRIHCLVMELIPGVDLRQWLSDRQHQPVTQDQALDWLQQILEILTRIHHHHCFHRDIKPSNIMLRPDGQLVLIDFGAVREVTETYLQKCEEDLTRTHVYSRGYTPIEQMQGRAVPESDFFALGRTFVHLMTGQNPLDFSTDAHTGQLLWQSKAPQISPVLADLMDCLMAPFPGQRPKTPQLIQVALKEIQANPGLKSTDPGTTLARLIRPQREASKQKGEDQREALHQNAVNVLGTLPLEEAASSLDFTQPPEDETVGGRIDLAGAVSGSGDRPSLLALSQSQAPSFVPSQQQSQRKSPWQRLLQRFAGIPLILLGCLLATGGSLGLRLVGILEPYEMQAFDTLLQLRPSEQADDRLLLVTIDEEDLAYQTEKGMVRQGSLADEALYQLLEKMAPHNPRVIGLDIYREATNSAQLSSDSVSDNSPNNSLNHSSSVNESSSNLQTKDSVDEDLPPEHPDSLSSLVYLQSYPNLIAVCSVGGSESGYATIEPPPTLPLDQLGFSDIPVDIDDRIRRQILGMDSAEPCNTTQSLSYQLASRYLMQSGLEPSMDEQRILSIGDRPFPPISNRPGGYQREDLGGYEVMLNYRQAETIAQRVSLQDMLSGIHDGDLENLVGDRIVLIGTTAPSFKDYHPTPYGQMAGVIIQAHMTSQVLSAALDNRPIIQAWATWGDAIWILGWAAASGVIAWFGRSRLLVLGGTIVLLLTVTGVSYGVLLLGGWAPLIPSICAIALTTAAVRAGKVALQSSKS